MKRSNAAVFTTNPGGTAMPARCSSPRLPPLPPTCGRSASPMSANQPMMSVDVVMNFRSMEDRHHAAPAVDADTLTILDARRGVAGADHRGQSELARHDRCMAHRAADVRHRAGDLRKDGCPGRIGDLADENVALLQLRNLLDRLHDAGRPLDDTVRGRETLDLVAGRRPARF